MKSKLLFLGTALLAIVAAVGFSLLDTDFQSRYQQHLEEPGPEAAQAAAEEDGTFHSHLPLLLLDTGGAAVPGMARDGSTVTAQVTVVDGGAGNNTPTGTPSLQVQAQIRYRGNSSLYFDKKSYRLKLTDAAGESLSQEMLGMAAEDEWILHGPFLDKSLLRNYMLMNLSGQVMSHTPEVRFCEVFLNGEYQGLYVLMQSVSRSLVEIDKSPNNQARTSYIVRLDRGGAVTLDQFLHQRHAQSAERGVSPLHLLYAGAGPVHRAGHQPV